MPHKVEEKSKIESYQSKIANFEICNPYKADTEIFNLKSENFIKFLSHCFTKIYPHFHYLTFLNQKDVEKELIKVAGILQILPLHLTSKITRFSDILSNYEVHEFWLRLFYLFEVLNQKNSSCASKVDCFQDYKTLNEYLNCDFPIITSDTLLENKINEEIAEWNNIIDIKENDNDDSFLEIEINENINIEKLITNVNQISSLFSHLLNDRGTENGVDINTDYSNSIINTIELSKSVLEHNKSLNVIESNYFNNISQSQALELNKLTETSDKVHFLKTFSNLANILEFKISLLNQ